MTQSKQTERNPGGMTALHLAAAYADLIKVTELLKAGANPNQLNDGGQPPLFNALELSMAEGPDVIPKRTAIFKTLWEATSPEVRLIQAKEGITIVQLMAIHGFADLTREILKTDPQLAKLTMHHTAEYPIHTAILNGHLDVAEALFDLDPNTGTYKNTRQQSALHYAARYGSEAMVSVCCEHRAGDIDEKDSQGKTPLTWAKEENNDNVQNYLIAQGANEDLVDSRATTTFTNPGNQIF